jgi:hypothetical protein
MYCKSMITKYDVNLLPCDRGNNNNEHPGIVKSNTRFWTKVHILKNYGNVETQTGLIKKKYNISDNAL